MYFQSVCKLVSNLHAKYWQLWQSACDQNNYMEVFSAALYTSLLPLTHLLQACVTQALVSVTSRLLVFHIKMKFFKFFLCVLVSMWLGYIWTSIKNNDSKMCLWFFPPIHDFHIWRCLHVVYLISADAHMQNLTRCAPTVLELEKQTGH